MRKGATCFINFLLLLFLLLIFKLIFIFITKIRKVTCGKFMLILSLYNLILLVFNLKRKYQLWAFLTNLLLNSKDVEITTFDFFLSKSIIFIFISDKVNYGSNFSHQFVDFMTYLDHDSWGTIFFCVQNFRLHFGYFFRHLILVEPVQIVPILKMTS